jgi:hypothetical protein
MTAAGRVAVAAEGSAGGDGERVPQAARTSAIDSDTTQRATFGSGAHG